MSRGRGRDCERQAGMPVFEAKVGQKHQSSDTSKSGVHDKISITTHES